MRARGAGAIVFIASVNALAHYGNPAYSAAKAGLLAYCRAIATEDGRHGIRANAICPGSVRTAAWDHRLERDPEAMRTAARYLPAGSPGGAAARSPTRRFSSPRRWRRASPASRCRSMAGSAPATCRSSATSSTRRPEACRACDWSNVSKRFGNHIGHSEDRPRRRRRRVRGAGGAVGLREVDAFADDRGAGGHFRRRFVDRRREGQRPAHRSSATSPWCSRATRCSRT